MDNDTKEMLTIIGTMVGVILVIALVLVVLPVTILNWVQSCKQAQIYNQIHAAQYTCSDFFWAGDQINSQTQTVNLDK